MLDHIGLTVRSARATKDFYTKALAPLGYGLVEEEFGWVGFGPPGKPLFWFSDSGYSAERPPTSIHLAFVAADHAAVDAFYAAAMAAGARDNGPPGLRAQYHPNYYGAFVLDPDGNNVEAVCHVPG